MVPSKSRHDGFEQYTDLRGYSSLIDVRISNEQNAHEIVEDRLVEAVSYITADTGFTTGSISLAIVDDPTIHQLNKQYLQHDYPTDVLSFVLERESPMLDGEVIVSADTAASDAETYGWKTNDELLLYVIHGTLHLVGFNDKTPEDQSEMHEQEAKYLLKFGLQHRIDPA